jgi:hypothetical protein
VQHRLYRVERNIIARQDYIPDAGSIRQLLTTRLHIGHKTNLQNVSNFVFLSCIANAATQYSWKINANLR